MANAAITRVAAAAYTLPTETPESDGTLGWDHTTMVTAEVEAAGTRGIGYSYTHAAAASLIEQTLAEPVLGADAMSVGALWWRMQQVVRNLGRHGIAAAAISAVDTALWDLKARLLGIPLVSLLGQVHASVPLYGSGGFTSYTPERLADQLAGWVGEGFGAVKMKVGREPAHDAARVRRAREAIGPGTELFVDANGAYGCRQALALAEGFAEAGVVWFEEPVPSDDRAGLRLLRERLPAAMEVSAGEYGYTPGDFLLLLDAGAVDVLQADATRCCGISGFLRVAALCEAFQVPLSTHTAPALHLAVACACRGVRHMEWFHDHVRFERMLFDGFVEPEDGRLGPDLRRHGHGLELRRAEARRLEAN